ncbi:MAG: DUF309 domain-containing protein [Halobacteriaceae archaeon]
MDDALRAGMAVFNAGRHHAAHDAWEDRWLAVKETDRDADERLLHGLIQFTAAVHHGDEGNWAGLQGLARSAGEYLDGLAPDERGVNVDAVRAYCAALAADPEHVEREPPPALTHRGTAVGYAELSPSAVALAAGAVAVHDPGLDEDLVARAATAARELAEETAGTGRSNEFAALLRDLLADPDHRGTVQRRLRQHVERRAAELADVDGLFDA